MTLPQRLAPPLDELRQFYLGSDIHHVPKPAVILDVARVRRHCRSMLEAVDALGVGFRAHVKTHKASQDSHFYHHPLTSARLSRVPGFKLDQAKGT